jgi:hypothetical protein
MILRKFPILTILIIAIALGGIVPVSHAENSLNQTNSSGPYYITIDPIGDHTIGDVFFINGTTNLPVTEKLEGGIATTIFFTGMPHSQVNYPGAILPDIPIVSTPSGTNRWSVNVTDVVVTNLNDQPGRWSPYVVTIQSKENSSIEAHQQEFSLLPATNATPTTALQTTIQSPSTVQTTTSAVPVLPTTRSSPLPVALPIAVIAAIAIVRSIYGKKRD